MSSIIKQIDKAFKLKEERNWDKIYFVFDIHETIIYPSHSTQETFRFYPNALSALKLISLRKDIVMILWSCSPVEKLNTYVEFFKNLGVNFDYINENPEVLNSDFANFGSKFYWNVGFDDKFGFDAEIEWTEVLEYFAQKVY